MQTPIFLAGLLLTTACLTGCGARADIGDDPVSAGAGGGGGAGGAGATSGPSGSGHGSSTAHGSTSSSGGPSATSSSSGGPGTSSSSAASSATSSGSGGQVCPGFGDGCTNCLSASCSTLWCTCTHNAACLALISCENGCKGDKNCQQGCLSAHPSGISDLYLLSDCAGTTCPGACPGNSPVDACTKCLFEDCAAAMNACLAAPECLQLYNCLKACGPADLACQQACYQAHGGGVPTLQAVLQCSTGPCKPSCN